MPIGQAEPEQGPDMWGQIADMLRNPGKISKLLQNPNVQRGMADFGQMLSQGKVDPRTGKPTQGIGSMMSGAAGQMVRRGEVSKEASAQAQQQQMMMKAYLELLGQRGQQDKSPMSAGFGPLAVGNQGAQFGKMPQAQGSNSRSWLMDMLSGQREKEFQMGY